MKQEKQSPVHTGKYLAPGDRMNVEYQHRCRPRRRGRRALKIMALLIWDGLLLYMIVDCLIEAAYGAVFIAVISVYMGYQMK